MMYPPDPNPPGFISSLSPDQAKELQAGLRPVMDAVIERIHYAESRRESFSVIAGVLVAAGIALLTIATDDQAPAFLTYGAYGGAASTLLLGTILFWMYSAQTNRYPWTDATRAWKWFYRNALPNERAFNLTWLDNFYFGKTKKRVQGEYNAQLTEFADKLADLRDPKVDLWQDIQQLYVLHVNEKYKNAFLTHIRKTLVNGLVGVAAVTVALSIVGAYHGRSAITSENAHIQNGLILNLGRNNAD